MTEIERKMLSILKYTMNTEAGHIGMRGHWEIECVKAGIEAAEFEQGGNNLKADGLIEVDSSTIKLTQAGFDAV